jgi:hypothetical protein
MTELCKQFCRKGHQVTVVTGWSQERENFAKELGFELIDLGKPFPAINRQGSNRVTSKIRHILGRGLQVFFEYPSIGLMWRVRQAVKKLEGFDLLISCAQPHPVHWGVAWARGKSKRIAPVWVADCGDPFMMSHFDTFDHPFYFAFLEKYFCRRADHISVPAITFRELFYPEFSDKLIEIPQGVNPDEFPVYQGEIPERPIKFAYAGMFMPRTRDPGPFLDYLAQRTDVDFQFHVYATTPQYLAKYQDKLGEKLQIKKPVPRQEVIYELSKHHFLVNIGYDPKTTIPSKLMDYWLTGRPILNVPNNAVDESSVDRFLRGDYSDGFKIPNPEKYRIDRVANQFLELGKGNPSDKMVVTNVR